MIVASHQPTFFPYMGYFYKVFKSDVFVLSDDVPYAKRVFQNYNNIKTPHGLHRITLPITFKNKCLMNEVQYKLPKEILMTIEMAYKKAPYFDEVFPLIKKTLEAPYDNLSELNKAMITLFIKKFGFKTELHVSSDLKFREKNKWRILEMCDRFDATGYYAGQGATDYLNKDLFAEQGYRLYFTDYEPVVYPQLWSEEFIPNLSVIDYVMNCGFTIPKEWKK